MGPVPRSYMDLGAAAQQASLRERAQCGPAPLGSVTQPWLRRLLLSGQSLGQPEPCAVSPGVNNGFIRSQGRHQRWEELHDGKGQDTPGR